LIAALGAAEGGKTKRSHFVFAKGGQLVDKKIPVKPADRYVVIESNEYVYTLLTNALPAFCILAQPSLSSSSSRFRKEEAKLLRLEQASLNDAELSQFFWSCFANMK
jgi:hypothetical protein